MFISGDLKRIAKPLLSGERPTFATVLMAIALRTYGTEFLDWEGETIQIQLKEDFDVDMPRRVYDQLMGLKTAITTDLVYHDVAFFDEFISAVCGHGVGTERDAPLVDDVAWAVVELQMNDPEPVGRAKDNPWTSDICKYVRAVLDDEGFSTAPAVLSFAKSTHRAKEGMDDPAYYAEAWRSAQAKADEVDQNVEKLAMELVNELQDIGIVPVLKDEASAAN